MTIVVACGGEQRQGLRSAVEPVAEPATNPAAAPDPPPVEVKRDPDPESTPETPETSRSLGFLTHPNTRALWVWDEQPSTRQLLENTDGARDELFAFVDAPHAQPSRQITRLFFEARQKTTPDASSILETVTYDPLTDPAARAALQLFVAEATSHGVAVEYLDGQAIWLATDDNARVPRQICADVVAYNQASSPDQRLAGVHLDIEPHTVRSGPWAGEWWEDRLPGGYNADWTRRWIAILDGCRATLDAYEARSGHAMTLSVDLGADYAFYNAPLRDYLDRADGPVDYLTLMNYFDNRPNVEGQPSFFHGDFDGSNLVGGVEQNLSLWTELPLLFGVETGPTQIAEDPQSFYQEGHRALHALADELVARHGDDPQLLGIAVHHYGPSGYAALRD